MKFSLKLIKYNTFEKFLCIQRKNYKINNIHIYYLYCILYIYLIFII